MRVTRYQCNRCGVDLPPGYERKHGGFDVKVSEQTCPAGSGTPDGIFTQMDMCPICLARTLQEIVDERDMKTNAEWVRNINNQRGKSDG